METLTEDSETTVALPVGGSLRRASLQTGPEINQMGNSAYEESGDGFQLPPQIVIDDIDSG